MAGSKGVIVHKRTGRVIQLGSAYSLERDLRAFDAGYPLGEAHLTVTSVFDENTASPTPRSASAPACPKRLSRVLRGHRPGPPPAPSERYERAQPGELLHLDTKKLGRIEQPGHRVTGDRRDHVRGAGWECLHVCIDDHSRFSHPAVRADERQHTAVAFLEAVVAHYRQLGIQVQRVMTDNGSCYKWPPSARPAPALGSSTCSPGPIRPIPTAKRSASSSPRCASGLMLAPIGTPPSAALRFPRGCNVTTGVAHTDHYNANHPSPGSKLEDNVLTTHT